MTFLDLFAAGSALLIAGMCAAGSSERVEVRASNADGNGYLVLKRDDSQLAADALGLLNAKTRRLIESLEGRHPSDERVALLRSRYDRRVLAEGSNKSGNTSYSVGKGRKLVMCLRDRSEEKKIEPMDVLTHVRLHQLAHLATNDFGHTRAFLDNFRWLRREAVEAGVYKYRDFSRSPATYCGIKLSSNL